MLIGAILRRRNESEMYDEDNSQGDGNDEAQKTPFMRVYWFVASLLTAVGGVVLFLLTEDLTAIMVLADKWTILTAIILVADIISTTFAYRKIEYEEAEKDAI
jgi:hypothetical protein